MRNKFELASNQYVEIEDDVDFEIGTHRKSIPNKYSKINSKPTATSHRLSKAGMHDMSSVSLPYL